MRKSACLLTLALLVLCSGVCWSQRDSSVFDGTPWEEVERERDAIENAILSGDMTSGLVLSGSSMFLRRNSAAFQDITTSVFRAYSGLSPNETGPLLDTLTAEAESQQSGLGWLEVGLLAQAAMKPASAVPAFQKALEDKECCELPLTYGFLGQSLLATNQIEGAKSAFRDAIQAASGHPSILFQVRHLYATSMVGGVREGERRQVIEECANSDYGLERAWGLQQQAEVAWREGDRETFERKVGEAVIAFSAYDASTEWQWRWDKDRWNQLERHLGHAAAALEGASDGMLVLDYEVAVAETYDGSMQEALHRLGRWLDDYPIEDVAKWNQTQRLWGQRLHLMYNHTLGRLGRTDEAIQGFYGILANATDTYHVKFEPHIYSQMGYALSMGDRLEESREAYETCLSLMDIPGEVLDPEVAYYRKGRMGKRARMGAVANYRNVLDRIARKETQR